MSRIILLTAFILSIETVNAQIVDKDSTNVPRKYVELEDSKPKLLLFQGFTVSADVFGPIQFVMSDYGCIEGAIRLNLKNTYFPIFEAGIGSYESTDTNTEITYSTTAPYARIGFDMNLLKNKFQENRLFVGVRFGISNYNYDYSGIPMKDPVWEGSSTLDLSDVNATSYWGELVFGVQVKVWSNFHMGWSVRLKKDFSTTDNQYSKPHFIPGYGTTTGGSTWGGTYSLIFDVDWGKKDKKATASK